MPIEGLPAQPDTPNADAQTTPDAAVNNTGADAEGADTQTATTEAQDDKKFTQADLDKYLSQRVTKAVNAKLKALTGEGEGTPTVEDLQRQLSDRDTELQSYRARDAVREHIGNAANKLNIASDNIRGIEALVLPLLTYTDGKPDNLKEAFESAKAIAPALFVNSTAVSINAGNGRNGHVPTNDMNALIRNLASGRN